jgi:hypothetical protein
MALGLGGCGGSSTPNNEKLAESEAQANQAAAEDGRINCALDGATNFDRTCTLDRMSGPNGPVLVVGRSDAGFRRFLIANDGRGLVSADGSEAATVTIVGDGLIEVAVANDRYRFPATVKSGTK